LHTISILIPALNEEAGITATISCIPKSKIQKQGYNLEILVIDGDSTDLTREKALQMGAKVVVEKRLGYGRAYKTGFSKSTGDILVTLDADGTYPAERIPEYIQLLKERSLDFITVNRFSNSEDGSMTLSHYVGNKILSKTMRSLYSVEVKDSQSGMWIMKRSFVEQINLKSDDMSLSEEIKIIAFKFFKSLEVDGKYSKRKGTPKLATFKHGWHNFRYLFQYNSALKFALKPAVEEVENQFLEERTFKS